MRAATLHGRLDLRIEERPIPVPGAGEALVRVSACGICGSDVRTYLRGPDHRYRLPVVLGHEFAGEVVAVGSGVTGLRVGDRVSSMPLFCGACSYCRRGEEHLCDNAADYGRSLDGAYAEYVLLPASAVTLALAVLPPDLSDEEATLAEPVACCLHGFYRSGLRPGGTLVIFGDGPIGMLHLLLARYHGAGQVIVLGHNAGRLAVARALGASLAFDAREEGRRDLIFERTAGRGADVVMAAAPTTVAIAEGAGLLRKGGSLVVFGGCPPQSSMRLDPNQLHYGELTVTGSFNCTRNEFERALQIIPHLGARPIITHRVVLDDAVKGMEAAARREAMKAIVVMPRPT